MKKEINGFLLVGMIGTSVFGSHFGFHYGRAMWGNQNIWWTPVSLALPIDETTKDFKLFLGGELLQNHIERGSLFATDQGGQTYQVVSDDIKVRVNNWHKIKASFFHSSIYPAFLIGVSITCLILSMAQLLTRRKDKQP